VEMTRRSTLGRVLDDLGETLLETLAGTVDPTATISAVVINDPLDPQVAAPDTMVLGVGLDDPHQIAALLREPGVAALVVRLPCEVTDDLRTATADSGAVLLGLTRGASWAQVSALLRSLLAVDDVGGETETLAGFPAGDLFSVANAVAALLDAPVTIEDRSSRVLAFSGQQDEADTGRIATILDRQVPERFRRALEARGVFRDLYASDDPIYVADIPDTELDRAAVRVRAGDEILGSIWAAIPEPLSDERARALADASKLVALHMLRARAGEDVERRLRSDLVATVLEGGRGAGAAASRLGIGSGGLCVLALGPRPSGSDGSAAQAEADFQRVCSAFAMHLSAVHPRSAAAPVGGVLYGVLPVSTAAGAPATRAELIARQFLERIGDQTMTVGIGRVVEDHTTLPRSRNDADRALRVLREGGVDTRVALASDVHVDALLLERCDLAALDDSTLTGPVARLAEYDVTHRSDLLETLRAWLDAFGDVNRAADAVHVHPNTFRYRLRRLSEVGEIDLGDADARFAAMLQLRLRDRSGPR
jgi:PucR C-terminal helix-turn-helix domain/GGDEF-like domain